MADSSIVIRKYENRRLYDTAASRYVNLEDVARLVREGRDVTVVDARTGEDVTRLVLAQIILEEARSEGAEAGVPLDFLRDLIRASDRATREVLQWSLALATEHSRKLGTLSSLWPWRGPAGDRSAEDGGEEQGGAPGETPASPSAGPAAGSARSGAPALDRAEPETQAVEERPLADEMVDLKRRLAQLESRVARERRRRRKREQDG
jgi:polyhydroxyalkanoate synthesis repressor PhaR